MRSVWKYQLALTDQPQSLMIPYKSGVLLGPHLEAQNGRITLWAEVDTDAIPEEYVFHVFGTGWEVPENVDYLGTVLMLEGRYVWHVFVEQRS